MSKKHILVTGGAGFIGSHLCEELLRRGYDVTCVDNFSTGNRDNIAHLSALTVIEGDVNKEKTWKKLATQPYDAVFHYAATVGVRLTEEHPDMVLADVQGLMHLAAFSTSGLAKKVIFASSSEVYGNSRKVPMTEDEEPLASTPYTTVKAFGEHVMQTLWTMHHIPTVSLRFFNVYGPRQNSNHYGFVIGIFAQQALANQPLTIFGNGEQTRDFVFVNDNIAAAVAALEKNEANGQIINIGTGQETRIVDLAQTIIAVAQKNSLLKPLFLPSRQLEILRRCASVTTMQRLLNCQCSTPVEIGIQATMASIQNGLTQDIFAQQKA